MINLNKYFPNLENVYFTEIMTGNHSNIFNSLFLTGYNLGRKINTFGILEDVHIMENREHKVPSHLRIPFLNATSCIINFPNIDSKLDIDSFISNVIKLRLEILSRDLSESQIRNVIIGTHPSKHKNILFDNITTEKTMEMFIVMPTTVDSFCFSLGWFKKSYFQNPDVNEGLNGNYSGFINRICSYYTHGSSNINCNKRFKIVDMNDLIYNKNIDKFYNTINFNNVVIDTERFYNNAIVREMIEWVDDFKKTDGFLLLKETFDEQTEFKSKLEQCEIIRG